MAEIRLEANSVYFAFDHYYLVFVDDGGNEFVIRGGPGIYGPDSNSVFGPITTLLHKSAAGQATPFPGRTYPTASVTGIPSAV